MSHNTRQSRRHGTRHNNIYMQNQNNNKEIIVHEFRAPIRFYHDKDQLNKNVRRSVSLTVVPASLAVKAQIVPQLLPQSVSLKLSHVIIYRETSEDMTKAECHALARDITPDIMINDEDGFKAFYQDPENKKLYNLPADYDTFLAHLTPDIMEALLVFLAQATISNNMDMPDYIARVIYDESNEDTKHYTKIIIPHNATDTEIVKLFNPENRPLAHNESNYSSVIPPDVLKNLPPDLKARVESGEVKPVRINHDGQIANMNDVPEEFKALVKNIAKTVGSNPDIPIQDKRKQVEELIKNAGVNSENITPTKPDGHLHINMDPVTPPIQQDIETDLKALVDKFSAEQIKGLLTERTLKALYNKYPKEQVENFIKIHASPESDLDKNIAQEQITPEESRIIETITNLELPDEK